MMKMHVMILSLMIFISIVFSSDLPAERGDNEVDSVSILNQHLAGSFKRETYGNYIILSYCPDNTCLKFKGEARDENALADFMLLYLYYVPSYVYLKKDIHGQGVFVDLVRDYALILLRNYSHDCKGENLYVISCTLRRLRTLMDFDVWGVRYDEGSVNNVNIDFNKITSEENLANTK